MAVGFTGIAYGAKAVTGYGFHFVMTETLQRAVCSGTGAAAVLEAFRGDLEAQFARFRFGLEYRGIEVLCVGFDYSSDPPETFTARVSNWTAGAVRSAFTVDLQRQGRPGFSSWVRVGGACARRRSTGGSGDQRPSRARARGIGGRGAPPTLLERARGASYIGRTYNSVWFSSRADEPAASRFAAHGATALKHPSLVTPDGIAYQLLVDIPSDPRGERRRRGDFRAALQFSPRRCPAATQQARDAELQARLASNALESLQRFLVEHRETAPPEVRPEEIVTSTSRSWRHVDLPADEATLRAITRVLFGMGVCTHEPPLAACIEARRFLEARRCSTCAAWSNTYMGTCPVCGSAVCTNLACPDLFGDPWHTLDQTNASVRHLPA